MPDNRPILLALDGSTAAEAALPFAFELSQLYGASLRLIHAIDLDDPSTAGLEAANERFSDYAKRLVRTTAGPAAAMDSVVVAGSPAVAVLEAAHDARFLVVASHGRSGFRATVVGSVADKIVRGAAVPVLFVPVGAAGAPLTAGPTIVGLDGSEAAEVGLGMARELAARLGVELYLVEAFDPLPPLAVEVGFYPVDLTDSMEESARTYLQGIQRPAERVECTVGPADAVIEEVARRVGAGLIVLSSHGKGLAKRITLGSITDRVMHHSQRPLLIVPAGFLNG